MLRDQTTKGEADRERKREAQIQAKEEERKQLKISEKITTNKLNNSKKME
jgi:hypothetical protein